MKVYNDEVSQGMGKELLKVLNNLRETKNFSPNEYADKKAEALNGYMKASGLDSCVVGISGGVDSAVVLALLDYASKKEDSPIVKIVPLLLPILDSSGVTNQAPSMEKGIELCKQLGIEPVISDITDVNNAMRKAIESAMGITAGDWAIGQLGSYSRMPLFYYATSLLSQEGFHAIVCGTTNKDEGGYIGFIGKASDAMVDVQVISDIHKSEVYSVADFFNIPSSIIEAAPSGDMYDGRTDEMVFGTTYDFVELYAYYLNFDENRKEAFLTSLSDEAKHEFQMSAANLEHIHAYNLHKYLGHSPAIHVDVEDASVEGGWSGNYDRFRRAMDIIG